MTCGAWALSYIIPLAKAGGSLRYRIALRWDVLLTPAALTARRRESQRRPRSRGLGASSSLSDERAASAPAAASDRYLVPRAEALRRWPHRPGAAATAASLRLALSHVPPPLCLYRPHLSTAWLPSVHPPGRPGRRGRARGAAASGLTERSDCRHHASHGDSHRLVRRRLNTLLPPDLPTFLSYSPRLYRQRIEVTPLLTDPALNPPPARHLSLFELVAEREDGPIESVAWRPRPGSELPNTTCGGSSLHEGSVRRRGGRLRKEPDSPRGAGPEARHVAHGAGRTTVLAGGAPARGADRNVAQSASSLDVDPTNVVYRREAGATPPMPPCGRRAL